MADKQLGSVDRHNLDDLAWERSAAEGAAEQARQNTIRAAAIARGEEVEEIKEMTDAELASAEEEAAAELAAIEASLGL